MQTRGQLAIREATRATLSYGLHRACPSSAKRAGRGGVSARRGFRASRADASRGTPSRASFRALPRSALGKATARRRISSGPLHLRRGSAWQARGLNSCGNARRARRDSTRPLSDSRLAASCATSIRRPRNTGSTRRTERQ